ncbi:MAG: PQQ-binding-like beta-propeller repeat protein [Deltaproteobacteria bacterium]|nr:PQQ-binding-like beta-propeller repeat protein [Deltaproteobacteria bacterium]
MNITRLRLVSTYALCLPLALVACGGSEDGEKEGAASDGGGAGGAGGDGGGGTGGGAPASPNWNMIGFDPGSTFHNPTETKISTANVASLTKRWEHDFGTIGTQGTPMVVGNRLYILAGNGVFAFDADSGAELWRTDGATPEFLAEEIFVGATGSGAYEDGTIYFQNGNNGWVIALDAETGALKWKTRQETNSAAAGWSSTVIAGDLVITGNSSGSELNPPPEVFRGSVVALDKKTGEVKWKSYTAQEGEDGASVWAAPSVDVEGGLVFAPTGNNYTLGGPGSDAIIAFDLKTGAERWRYQARAGDVFTILRPNGNPDYDMGGNPVVYDHGGKKLVAIGQKSGEVFVFDRINGGEPLARRNLGGATAMPGGMFQALAYDGERLIGVCNAAKSDAPGSEPANMQSVRGSTSVLFGLDPVTLDIVYERQLPAYVWGPVTVANGVGYVGIEKQVQAFDAKTGVKLYTFETPGTVTGGVVVSEGRLFFPSGMNFAGSGHPDGHFYSLGLP